MFGTEGRLLRGDAFLWLRRLSIRWKLILFSMVTSSLGLFLASALLIWVDQNEASRLLAAEMVRQAQIVGGNSTAALTFRDDVAASEILASLSADSRIQSACIYDEQEQVFACYFRNPGAIEQPQTPGMDGHQFVDDSLAVFVPIRLDGSRLGTVHIEADLRSLEARMQWFLEVLFCISLGVCGFVYIVASRIQNIISKPIVSLSEVSKTVAEQEDYSVRAVRTSEDELGQLVDSFNLMLERIQGRDEKLVLAKNHALAATQAKSEFLANMSHEIRTPMTAILGFSENLRDEGLAAADRRHAIDTILRNGDHLLEIINNILDISKIEAGMLTIENVECCPARIVSDVNTLMRVRAEARGLTLTCELENQIPEFIESDPTRLKQILVNLVGNALKFTEAGGVRVVTRMVHSNSELEFDVIDTGIGMTEAQITKLFQPFTQADESMTRRFGGTGLGLSISQRLAHLLGGSISVHSEAGEGSTFRVRITARVREQVRLLTSIEEIHRGEEADTGPKDAQRIECRLLLAEDGPDNQRLISFLLEKAGAKVTVAENGRIAVDKVLAAKAEGHPFDIILMDMQMPELDGYGATRELRQSDWRGPIIALTANAMAEDRDRCLAAGCNEFATKPVNRKKLINLIHQHLQ